MTTRITAVDPAQASGKAKQLLDAVQSAMGMTPNMTRTMVQSPAVLEGYLGLSGALGHGSLPNRLRQELALAVGEANRCAYCVSAHNLIGKRVGLKENDILAAREFHAENAKEQAALTFARRVLEAHGAVDDADVEAARSAGYTEGEVAEIVAHVALNIFTNYFNLVAKTEIDFPKVELLAGA